MAEGYVELSPKEISKKILSYKEGKLVIIAPTIITTEDDMILLLGRNGRFGRRLPTLETRNFGVARYGNPFDLTTGMLSRLFSNSTDLSNPDESHFLSLLKDRSTGGRVIIPTLVELDYVSEDSRLLPCEDWKNRHHDHPDLHWVDIDNLPDLVVNAGIRNDDIKYGVSPATATMLDYYLENDTYVPDVSKLTPSSIRQ